MTDLTKPKGAQYLACGVWYKDRGINSLYRWDDYNWISDSVKKEFVLNVKEKYIEPSNKGIPREDKMKIVKAYIKNNMNSKYTARSFGTSVYFVECYFNQFMDGGLYD